MCDESGKGCPGAGLTALFFCASFFARGVDCGLGAVGNEMAGGTAQTYGWGATMPEG
jgi:hypothetical protein